MPDYPNSCLSMKWFLLITIFQLTLFCNGQDMTNRQLPDFTEKYARTVSDNEPRQNVRIVFYNVENLYDPYNDSLTLDEEFTASGVRRWSYSRFQQKLNQLSKTIIAIGEREPPAIVGMCEVENKYVLNKLIYQTPLRKFSYKVIHKDSPDLRGVDVALIYRPDKFKVILWHSIHIQFPFDTTAQTREILMVKGEIFWGDTIILFVNHWPSRRGGYLESQPKRNFVAGELRSVTDSIFRNDIHPNIIIMGDFNDEPDNISLSKVLSARPISDNAGKDDLINLMYKRKKSWHEGTLKYQGQWSVFDQFIVSGNLVQTDKDEKILHAEAHIFTADFLVENDEKYLGRKLKRTYAGPRYLGGFSDHLPIYLDLKKN
jgi:hypothetical protein